MAFQGNHKKSLFYFRCPVQWEGHCLSLVIPSLNSIELVAVNFKVLGELYDDGLFEEKG